jgi:hypothetical protein
MNAISAGWAVLARELEAWRDDGRSATLWWRDDDAVQATPALQRLLALSGETTTPVALAVIPRDAGRDLRTAVAEAPTASVLQHGWAHASHASGDDRQNEYGPERPLAVRIAELAEGWRRIAHFPRALPVFVAPWNRADPSLLPALPRAGLTGISTLGPRAAAEPAAGVRQVNVHVDIVNWQTRRFAGSDAALGQLVAHLRARRTGRADPEEPTGVMTHHGFHDEDAWAFLAALIAASNADGAARWVTAAEAFAQDTAPAAAQLP